MKTRFDSAKKRPSEWDVHHKAVREEVELCITKLGLADEDECNNAAELLMHITNTLLDRVMHAEGIKQEYNLPIAPDAPMPMSVPIAVSSGMTVLDMIALCMHNGIAGDAIFMTPGGNIVSVVQVTPFTVQLW